MCVPAPVARKERHRPTKATRGGRTCPGVTKATETPPACPASLVSGPSSAPPAAATPQYCRCFARTPPEHWHPQGCVSPVDEKTPGIVFQPILCVCDGLHIWVKNRREESGEGEITAMVGRPLFWYPAHRCVQKCVHGYIHTPTHTSVSGVFLLHIIELSTYTCRGTHAFPEVLRLL